MTRVMRSVLLFGLMVLICSRALVDMKSVARNKERLQRLRQEALNVSMYTDSLIVPFQSSAGIAKNGTDSIHQLVDRLQSYSDPTRTKKYFIEHVID